MSGFARKKPFVTSIGRANQKQVADATQLAGKALPCHVTAVSGQIVTVAFDVTSGFTLPSIAVPIFGPEYARSPTQVGDRGVVFPCDVRIGNVSGLGAATAPELTPPGNLSALVFFPVGNANWEAVDPRVYTIYGPGGVTLRTQDKKVQLDVSARGIIITMTQDDAEIEVRGGPVKVFNSPVIVFDSDVIVSGGDVTADGISLKHHVHGDVQTGSDQTGEPVG